MLGKVECGQGRVGGRPRWWPACRRPIKRCAAIMPEQCLTQQSHSAAKQPDHRGSLVVRRPSLPGLMTESDYEKLD